jgi:hypothetical protein
LTSPFFLSVLTICPGKNRKYPGMTSINYCGNATTQKINNSFRKNLGIQIWNLPGRHEIAVFNSNCRSPPFQYRTQSNLSNGTCVSYLFDGVRGTTRIFWTIQNIGKATTSDFSHLRFVLIPNSSICPMWLSIYLISPIVIGGNFFSPDGSELQIFLRDFRSFSYSFV